MLIFECYKDEILLELYQNVSVLHSAKKVSSCLTLSYRNLLFLAECTIICLYNMFSYTCMFFMYSFEGQ